MFSDLRLIFCLLVVCDLWLAPAARAQSNRDTRGPVERNLELLVGEQTTVPAHDVAKYSEGTPGVIETRLPKDGEQFVVVAIGPGQSTLLFLLKDGSEIRYTFTVRTSGVKARDNIRLDFYFVQLEKSGSYRVGVAWPGTVGGTASLFVQRNLSDKTTSATASIAAQVLPRIDMAEEGGWARIRRQATLVLANGERGRFASGGEVNFRVEGNLSSGVQAISFGSEIKVRARYDRNTGRIEVHIDADVSELTRAGADGLPGRTVSHVETVVNLELGQSIVLAGLHAESKSRGRAGIPFFSQLPVVGALFGSHSGRRERAENVLFIVPTVVEAISMTERNRVREAYQIYRTFEGYRKGKRLVDPAPVEASVRQPSGGGDREKSTER